VRAPAPGAGDKIAVSGADAQSRCAFAPRTAIMRATVQRV